MSNTQLTAITLLVLAVHIVALTASLLLKRGAGALLAVNLSVAGIILTYVALHPNWLDSPVDWQILGLAVFELVAVVAAIATRWRVRLAVPISCMIFGVHSLASASAVAFALTFKITRLI